MRRLTLSDREVAHVRAALRYWGRAAETSTAHPADHWVARPSLEGFSAMSLDELEALIGKIDKTFKGRRRPWNPMRDMMK